MTKTAMITGITGQDGSYLVDFLLEQNYEVIGLYRRSSTNTLERVKHALDNPNFKTEEFDLTDPSGCNAVINKYQPDELYNLAAQSHVGTSFKQPTLTFEINALGVTNVLEAIRNYSPKTKLYQASTSEMFGSNYSEDSNLGKYQNENTAFLPQSPYAISKLAAHNMVRIYREAYGIFACCGILFNHESPRRGENFVTRKITKYIGELAQNKNYSAKLKLGNLEATRDWGHAADYIKGMHAMLQHTEPKDFVLATGSAKTVSDFLVEAFGILGIKNYMDYVTVDPDLYRPCEVPYLKGDASLAKRELGWEPSISFKDLVKDMVESDMVH
jgi:GDPmannose 4,6-dehydratase